MQSPQGKAIDLEQLLSISVYKFKNSDHKNSIENPITVTISDLQMQLPFELDSIAELRNPNLSEFDDFDYLDPESLDSRTFSSVMHPEAYKSKSVPPGNSRTIQW